MENYFINPHGVAVLESAQRYVAGVVRVIR